MNLRDYILEKVNPKAYHNYSEVNSNGKVSFGFQNSSEIPDVDAYILIKSNRGVELSTPNDYASYFKSLLGVSFTEFRDKVVEHPSWIDSKLSELKVVNSSDNRKFFNQISKLLSGESRVVAKDNVFYLLKSKEDVDSFISET